MKKNLLFVLIIVFVLGVLAFNYQRLVSFFEHHDESILARVNGEPISLEEVEKLYDMRNVHLNSPAPDVERVQKEYAEILYNRIIQVLISQELKKRNASVSQDEVTAYENKIKKSYGELLEQQSFEDYLAEYGIDYKEWLKQLQAQVENDALHALLQKEIALTTEETIQYADKIKEQQNTLTKIKFYKIIGSQELLHKIQHDITFSKNAVAEKCFSGKDFIHYFEEKGAVVYKALFDSDSLPDEYKSVLVSMDEHTFSAVQHDGDTNYILYLEQLENPKQDDAVDLYLLAEERLVQEKLPEVYADWLAKAIKKSDISVVNSFKDVLSMIDFNKANISNDDTNISKLHDVLREIKN